MDQTARRWKVLAFAGATMALASCVSVSRADSGAIAAATLIRADGSAAGTAKLVRQGEALALQVAVAGLAPGPHGLHLHAVGRCDPPEFTSAQGHWNPGGRQHGPANPAGPHAGDMPNLVADAHGRAALTVPLNDQADRAGLESLFDADGTAIVIHAGPDDMRTDPSGNSGGRIACGVLLRA